MEVVVNAVLIYLEATVVCVKMATSCIQINGIAEVGTALHNSTSPVD